MYFRLGTRHTHSVGEVEVRSSWEIHRDDADRPYSVTEKWTLVGEIISTNSTTTLAAIALLEAAYNPAAMPLVGFAGLYYDTATPSHLYWNAAASITGIEMVGGIRYPKTRSVEHLTSRTYEIDLQATFEIAGTSKLIAYRESLDIKGNGGPRIAVIETRNTDPVYQQVSKRTPVMMSQQGKATGRFDYPMNAVPPALFPAYLQNPEDAIGYDDPIMTPRGIYKDYTVRWNYMMILPRRFFALPHFRPRG